MLMIRRHVPAAATRTRPGLVLDRCQADGVARRIYEDGVSTGVLGVYNQSAEDRCQGLYSILPVANCTGRRNKACIRPVIRVTVHVGHKSFGSGFGDAVLPYNRLNVIVSLYDFTL